MTSLIRWNPRRDMFNLRQEFDRLFDSALDQPAWRWHEPMTWGLALDVVENDDAFVVKASAPGVDPDDIDITLTNNILTIKGEYKADEKFDEDKYHIRERRIGSFARSVTLPVGVKAEEIEATYASGILTLTVPKAEEVKPRRIQIKAGNNGNEPKTIEGEVGKS